MTLSRDVSNVCWTFLLVAVVSSSVVEKSGDENVLVGDDIDGVKASWGSMLQMATRARHTKDPLRTMVMLLLLDKASERS